jgi:hypothetical protein
VLPPISAREDSFAQRATDAESRLAGPPWAMLTPRETVFLDSSSTAGEGRRDPSVLAVAQEGHRRAGHFRNSAQGVEADAKMLLP